MHPLFSSHFPLPACARRVFALALLAVLASFAAQAAPDAKNVAPVFFDSLPSDLGAYMRAHPERWNFGFRPYDASASDLWTDPQVQRDATGGKTADDIRPTAISFAMDARGLTALLFCGEPSLTNCYLSGANFPAPSAEFFVCPGDADMRGIRHHYHMYYNGSILQEFPWLSRTRDFRPLLPYTTFEEQVLPNGVMLRLTYAWEGMFDYLPCVDEPEKDNFWRFSAIRWAKGGGQTWGGKVHAPSSAGYIRFPVFTRKQRAAILSNVLRAGWRRYRASDSSFDLALGNGQPYPAVATNLYIRQELAAAPRSYVNVSEDPGFRPTLAALRAERDALGPGLAGFDAMDESEQLAFYKKASRLLFNFREDVEDAYRAYQERRLKEPFGGPAPEEYVCKEGDKPLAAPSFRRGNAPDIDKMREELAGLAAAVAAATTPDARARLSYREAELRFLLAVDDKPEAHLAAMAAAATAKGVTPQTTVELLHALAGFRRERWRRFGDAFDFERDAWKALEASGGATNAFARRQYHRAALKLAAAHYPDSWRSDSWNLLDEYSQEHILELAERGLADEAACAGRDGVGFRGEMADRKWSALVAMARDAEAERFLLDCLSATNRFDKGASRKRLVAFYRATARRYQSDPDPATLEKALQYADNDKARFEIAWDMKDYLRAAAFAATDVQRGDAAFALGAYAAAAGAYARVKQLGGKSQLRYVQALYALGRVEEAIPVLEDYHARARNNDKAEAAFYLKRLKSLPVHSDRDCVKAFLSYMDRKAKALGMTGTHYDSPSGLTQNSYSTPQDGLKLGLAAAANPEAMKIWNTPSRDFSVEGTNSRAMSVKNIVISGTEKDLTPFYPLLGGKGGSLTYSDHHRAQILLVDVKGRRVLLSLMALGKANFDNIYKSAKELCDMMADLFDGKEPSEGPNLQALVAGKGGYAACVVPGGTVTDGREYALSKSPAVSRYPASTTKVMTMLCALDFVKDTEAATVTVAKSDISGGSGSKLFDGDRLTMHDALRIMMMESSNSLANTVARTVGRMILAQGK